jgi:hypothetical protein
MHSRSMNFPDPGFSKRKRPTYPLGLVVRVQLVSGRQVEGRITNIQPTSLGIYFRVEFGQEVASITVRQVLGFYDFCFLGPRRRRVN